MDRFLRNNKRKIIILLFICMSLFIWTGCNSGQNSPQESQEQSPPPLKEEPPRIEEVTIAAVGDVMVHSPQFKAAYVGGDLGYDFYPVFQPIEKYIKEADIGVANLETTLAGKEKKYTGYPMFNSPEQLAKGLKDAGFNLITTANNHSLDRRSEGVKRTLENLEEQGLDFTGTARSQEERDRVLIKEVKGIRIAFLAYTYGTNGIPIPENEPYIVNLIDKEQMKEDIKRAKDEKVDMISVSLHFGLEYQRDPNEEQKELVDFLLEQGVDIILGSHPHVIQPMEIREVTTVDGEEKESFVIYSLGNFVSNQRDRYKDSGLILQISLEKNFKENKTSLKKVEYIPTWVDKSNNGGKLKYEVVAVEEKMEEHDNNESSSINSQDYEKLKRTWEDTTNHLEQDNAKLVIKSLEQ